MIRFFSAENGHYIEQTDQWGNTNVLEKAITKDDHCYHVTAVLTSIEINYDWENNPLLQDNILLLIKLFMDYVELWSIEMKVKRIDDALKASF